jgi:hypothetical protein
MHPSIAPLECSQFPPLRHYNDAENYNAGKCNHDRPKNFHAAATLSQLGCGGLRTRPQTAPSVNAVPMLRAPMHIDQQI